MSAEGRNRRLLVLFGSQTGCAEEVLSQPPPHTYTPFPASRRGDASTRARDSACTQLHGATGWRETRLVNGGFRTARGDRPNLVRRDLSVRERPCAVVRWSCMILPGTQLSPFHVLCTAPSSFSALKQLDVVCERNRDPSRTTTPAGGLRL